MPGKWEKSEKLLERARRTLAGGVSSPFRARHPKPLYFRDACGCRLFDVDGNEYIDYSLSWGPIILGHRHPRLTEAVSRAALGPHTYGAQHELEPEVGELFQRSVPCAERVAFCSSGSEAVQLAFRLARGFTGRSKILKFEGHYHGWMDSALWSYKAQAADMGDPNACVPVAGSKGQLKTEIVTAPWNSIEALEGVFASHGSGIAAAIMEPVLVNSGSILPRPGYLEFVRKITKRYGALLILDEVITGFRIAPGGAQAHFGVTPDLATFGKALAAGMTLSAVAGRADIMELMVSGGVAFGGTFNGNPVALAAAKVALEELTLDGGAALSRINALGESLMSGLREITTSAGVPAHVCGFGAAFSVHFSPRTEMADYRDTLDDDAVKLRDFVVKALERGIYLLPDGRFYLSAAHTEFDIDRTLSVFREILEAK
jgi:glutamate-1-semialdehyde 2,1-aminomutase